MILRPKRSVAILAAAATAGVALFAAAGPAFATNPTPAWEPDPATSGLGQLVFYDASGNVLTGGSMSHLADYAAGTSTGDPTIGSSGGTKKATLYFSTPQFGKTPDQWGATPVSGTTAWPSATAPNPIKGPGFANPVVTLGGTDANATGYLGGHPSDSNAGYQNMLQVRLIETDTDGNTTSPKYFAADVLLNPGAGTWSMFYPNVATTTTSLSTTPASGSTVTTGGTVQLNATVSPAENGTVQFLDGSTAVGSPQTVTTSNGNATVTDTPALGSHSYTAKFTPTGGTEVQGSNSSASTITVSNALIGTNVTLSVNPNTTPQFGTVTLTSDVGEADASTAGEAGTVTWKATQGSTTTTLASKSTHSTVSGKEEYTASPTISLTPGSYTVTAFFVPTDSADYANSQSAGVSFTVTAPACPGDPTGAACTDDQTVQVTVNAGSLTISTPYTPAQPFVLPDMQLNAAGTKLTSGPTRFPATGSEITVTSTVAGDPNWSVSVTATDLVGQNDSTHVINGENLGLTGGAYDPASPSTFPGNLTFTGNPSANGVSSTDGGTSGLKGSGHTFVASGCSGTCPSGTVDGGNGTAQMHGMLTLIAPTSTKADTYVGTITFSVA